MRRIGTERYDPGHKHSVKDNCESCSGCAHLRQRPLRFWERDTTIVSFERFKRQHKLQISVGFQAGEILPPKLGRRLSVGGATCECYPEAL